MFALAIAAADGSVTAASPAPLTASPPQEAATAMRDIRFRGMKRAIVLAQYGPGGEIAGGEASDALCAEVLALAQAGAPVPIDCATPGDARLADSANLVVIVQASVRADPAGSGKLFAVTARPQFTGGLEPAPQHFGAAPLVVRYAETPAGHAARAQAIAAALDEVLPWRRAGGRQGLTGE